MVMDEPVLIHEHGTDYKMPEDMISCWITVGNISVYVVQRPSRCVVELYAKKVEADDEGLIDRAVATYKKSEEIQKEYN